MKTKSNKTRKGPWKHGMSYTPSYSSWMAMKRRCENEKNSDYPYYGGRGIKVCERWQSFDSFLTDMGERPAGMTIDRIDTKGDYEPCNCRWATRKEQSRNKRNNVVLTFHGETKTLPEWADHLKISIKTLRSRLFESKWTVEKVLSIPAMNHSQAANFKLMEGYHE